MTTATRCGRRHSAPRGHYSLSRPIVATVSHTLTESWLLARSFSIPKVGATVTVPRSVSMNMRAIRRAPAFFLLAVATLAVGVGSSVAIFGIVNQLLLRPVAGVSEPDDVGYLELRSLDGGLLNSQGISLRDFDVLRDNATLLAGVASQGTGAYDVAFGGAPSVRVTGSWIYGDYFTVLGVRPTSGRLLRADELGPDADPRSVVVGEELSRRLFGATSGVVGRTVLINGETASIVGVAAGFSGPERFLNVQLWFPYAGLVTFNDFPRDVLTNPRYVMHKLLYYRLRRDQSRAAGEQQLASAMARLVNQDAERTVGNAVPHLTSGLRVPPSARVRVYGLLVLFGTAAGLLLFAACVNVATLLLVRHARRRSEIATQRALGATLGGILRLELAQSLLIAAGGLVGGLAIAWCLGLSLRGRGLPGLSVLRGFSVDGPSLLFAGLAAVVASLAAGAVPAFLSTRLSPGALLREGSGIDSRRMRWARRVFSSAQIALCVPLLVGTALLTRTLINLTAVDTGVDTTNVWTWALSSGQALQGLRIESVLPGLQADIRKSTGLQVAFDARGPFGATTHGLLGLPSRSDESVTASVRPVSPGWFEQLGVSLIAGRSYDPEEWGGAVTPLPTILTASLARRLFGSASAIGQRLNVGVGQIHEAEVVGVTNDLVVPSSPDSPQDAFFVPIGSVPQPELSMVLRSPTLSKATISDIRSVVESALSISVAAEPVPLASQLQESRSTEQLLSRLIGLIAVMSLLLAFSGVHGVVAYAAQGRVREFGIRVALGAQPVHIRSAVLKEALGVIGGGMVVGIVLGYLFSILLESQLFGVSATDPVAYIATTLLLAGVGLLASWAPARAAIKASPLASLRAS